MITVCVLLFASAGCFVLAASSPYYLRKFEELSLFMSGSSFFSSCMEQPGGLIVWCSTFLTQFFFHPWIGTAVMVLALIGLWFLFWRASRLPARFFVMACVPSAMMLLAMFVPGYLIYILKSPGYAYNGILGIAVALALAGLYRLCSRHTALAAAVMALIPFLYPLFGFYALYAVLLCMVLELSGRRSPWPLLAGAVAVAAVPWLYFYFVESHLMLANAYTALLPRFGAGGSGLWMPYIVALAYVPVLLAVAPWLSALRIKPEYAYILGLCALLPSLYTVYSLRYTDSNFAATLKMDMDISDGDYRGALDAAHKNHRHPTRAMGLFTHIALSHIGQAGDSLFTFRFADTEYATPRPDVALRTVGSHPFNFHFGRVNDCYRWCMEDMVEYGPKVEYLKYMSRCAILNGEYPLARRYLRMLSRTLYHKDWARKYMAMTYDPALAEKDPELAYVRKLNAFNNHIGGDGSLIETYISTNLAALEGGPPELVEMSLQFNLVRKDINGFWPRFILYARTHERLPVHYQEAALLFSALEHKVDCSQFRIDPEVAREFNLFMEMAQKNAHLSEEHNRHVFGPFGKTYWYYYFFTKGLKTT